MTASPESLGSSPAPSGGLANLGMYPFAEVRWAFDRFWEAVTDRLPWLPPALDWDVDLHGSWRSERLVVGHTCGWPLVTELRDSVRVVGAFTAATAEGEGHSYRSVLVARWAGEPEDFAGAVAAVNNGDSLSGWISLVAAVHGAGARWLGAVKPSGGHLESLRMVRDGEAEVASIDSVTLELARRHRPMLLDGVVEIGTGPLVPCLPVIAGPTISERQVDELRAAMVDAVFDPLVEPAARAMITVGFVPLGIEHYLPLLDLAPAP